MSLFCESITFLTSLCICNLTEAEPAAPVGLPLLILCIPLFRRNFPLAFQLVLCYSRKELNLQV